MNEIIKELDIHEVQIGMAESSSHIISSQDIESFAKISGDNNPIHLDEKFAATTQFKKRIAHGLMSSSYFSALFGRGG